MKFGISTACFFTRKYTEDALSYLADNGVKTAEVFLGTFSEYTKEFAKVLNERKKDTEIRSVHALNTQFEPQLYNKYVRAKNDAFGVLDNVLDVAEEVGAKYLTFHGVARIKKTPINVDFDFIGERTNEIISHCKERGLDLSFENVHWAYYNEPGFFTELKKRCPLLRATLDVKQARQSGYPVEKYIEDMGDNISTVHLSDTDENGKIILPGKNGKTDLKELKNRLLDVGFDGAVILEVYPDGYKDFSELTDSLLFVEETFAK